MREHFFASLQLSAQLTTSICVRQRSSGALSCWIQRPARSRFSFGFWGFFSRLESWTVRQPQQEGEG